MYGAKRERSRCQRSLGGDCSRSRLPEHVVHLVDEPLMAARVGRLSHACPCRKNVVAAGGNRVGELLPRLAQLALEPITDDRISDSFWHCEPESGVAQRVGLTRKPVQR